MSFLKPLTLTLVISILILFLINLFQNIKSQSSKLVIDSIPKTEVFIDGNRIGETPVSEISKKEEVQVKLKKDDLSYEKYITLTKGVETILKISLNQDIHKTEEQILTLEATGEKKSSISLTTEPDGVQIYLDGNL
ncbi:MAG: PEGA domain-containing protein [Candidatus Woesebacteria bacterium]|nr:MAG: PEGA domain-containing protein [Candidatus Woesebacteria bacterium]